jgi:Domain of unknown function (DUF6916)
MSSLQLEDFARHLQDAFALSFEGGTVVRLVLVEASGIASEESPRPAPFSLLFRGPRAPVLPQRTYRIAKDAFGEVDIFLVPVGQSDGGIFYEAVFN